MSNLRSRLIRLAHENEALRPHILPLIKEGAAVPWERELEHMQVGLPPGWPAAFWRKHLERGRDALLGGKFRPVYVDRLGGNLSAALVNIEAALTLAKQLQGLQDERAEIDRKIESLRGKAAEIGERQRAVLSPLNRP